MFRVYYLVNSMDQVKTALKNIEQSEIGFWGVMVSVLFFGSHGAWAGGIRGISHANYHLKPYLDDIRKGHYLIIVDVDREEQRKKVHRLLDHSLDAERQGDESAFSPLL